MARVGIRMALTMALLSPAALILFGSVARTLWKLVIPVALFLAVGCVACVRVFQQLELLTTVEMDFRNFQAEKEARGCEVDRGVASTQ